MSTLQRPTLPSLKSLLLPTPIMHTRLQDSHRQVAPCMPLFISTSRPRQVSISSSNTSPGPVRTPSLSPSPPGSPSSSSGSSQYALCTPPASPCPTSPPRSALLPPSTFGQPEASTSKFRLVPTSLSQADAILYVPPRPHHTAAESTVPSLSSLAPISQLSRKSSHVSHRQTSKALLLVGPAMNHLRGMEGIRRQIALGARVHPYKIVRGSRSAMPSRRASLADVPIRDVRPFSNQR